MRRRRGIATLWSTAALALAVVVATIDGSGRGRCGEAAEEPVATWCGASTPRRPEGWCLPRRSSRRRGSSSRTRSTTRWSRSTRRASTCPYLAESVTPNATYDQWTIKLRPGVKFHDGLRARRRRREAQPRHATAGSTRRSTRASTSFVFANVADVQGRRSAHAVGHHEDTVARVPGPAVQRRTRRDRGAGAAQRPRPRARRTSSGPARSSSRTGASTSSMVVDPQSRLLARRATRCSTRSRSGRSPTRTCGSRSSRAASSTSCTRRAVDVIVAAARPREGGQGHLYESDKGAEVAYLMLNSSKPPFDDILARKAVAVRPQHRRDQPDPQSRHPGARATARSDPGTMG